MSLGFGEEISNLDLSRKIVEGDDLIMYTAPCKVCVDANVLGQLMLDRIGSNLKSLSAVTMKGSGGDN